MTAKITKKAQVAFNQFMFDTMMDKVRDAALLEEKIVVHEDLLKVHVQKIGDLERRTDFLTANPMIAMDIQIAKDMHAAIETLKTQATNSASRITALTNEVLKLRDAQKKHPFSEREEPVPCVDTMK